MTRRRALLWLAAVTLAGPAWAADGVLEINEACVATGCYAGDSPGFPVQTVSGRSHVLTSNLVVPDTNTGAIEGSTGTTIDLNGFSVSGPVTCTRPGSYDPTLISCTGSGSGNGVSVGARGLVRNGRIHGFGRYGVLAAGGITDHTNVEDVRVEQNAAGGIYLSGGSLRNVNVTLNGGPGIFNLNGGDANLAITIDDCSVVFNKGDGIGLAAKIRNCVISYNGGAGIYVAGQNSSISDCQLYRNSGKAINAWGSYRDNEITGNDDVGGQVIGTMSDEGGNNVH